MSFFIPPLSVSSRLHHSIHCCMCLYCMYLITPLPSQSLGRKEQAVKDFKALLDINPENHSYHYSYVNPSPLPHLFSREDLFCALFCASNDSRHQHKYKPLPANQPMRTHEYTHTRAYARKVRCVILCNTVCYRLVRRGCCPRNQSPRASQLSRARACVSYMRS